jgi:HD-GYP domain-containing protein (c-di-GMP phosphodiesterase class II)
MSASAMKDGSLAVCEVASRLADALGFEPEVRRDITEVYERWDGKGFPSRIPAERVSVPARVVAVAETAEILARLDGLEAARTVVAERSARAFDAEVAACFAAHADEVLGALDRDDLWSEMLAAEPGAPARPGPDELERALRAVGDFDLKSPYTIGHSRGVAELARGAAAVAGLDDAEQRRVLLAGLVHDLGRVGVTALVWGKQGPLSRSEWEQVRLHPYTTERVLARAASPRDVVAVAAAHHERLDGTCYHRVVPASVIAGPARLLPAADAFHAMTEPRPHRAALTPAQAAGQLRREAARRAPGRRGRRGSARRRRPAGPAPAHPGGSPPSTTCSRRSERSGALPMRVVCAGATLSATLFSRPEEGFGWARSST